MPGDDWLMTRQKQNQQVKSTPFSDWLRSPDQDKLIGSHLGYWASDMDFIWYDSNLAQIMLIEEKCRRAVRTEAQRELQSILDQALKFSCPRLKFRGRHVFLVYRGYYVVQFENTTPDNGRIWINGGLVSREGLIALLRFESFPT